MTNSILLDEVAAKFRQMQALAETEFDDAICVKIVLPLSGIFRVHVSMETGWHGMGFGPDLSDAYLQALDALRREPPYWSEEERQAFEMEVGHSPDILQSSIPCR